MPLPTPHREGPNQHGPIADAVLEATASGDADPHTDALSIDFGNRRASRAMDGYIEIRDAAGRIVPVDRIPYNLHRAPISRLDPGRYDVRMYVPGVGRHFWPDVAITAGENHFLPSVREEGIRLTVRVVDADGEPIAGCRRRILGAASGRDLMPCGSSSDLRHQFAGSTPTDTAGEVVIREWPAGEYRIEVIGPDGLSGGAEVEMEGETGVVLGVR